ncbi:MAG TPA: hypothetical protein VNI60_01265 [Pyrinomonadaceae bacterium]|nr:hypothetical protein [Pyrinomonadaceae bacterium]
MFLKSFLPDKRVVFWVILAGIITSAYSLAPQIQLWGIRGDAWNGVYAYHDHDEMAYTAYIQTLIDGKPRRNSPYTGREDSTENPLDESLFSIQFLAFYPIVLPARFLGISSSTAMILFSAIIGFLSALALFWLLNLLFEKPFLSFVGTVLVFSVGALVAGQGSIISRFSPDSIYYPIAFPFARRTVPSIGFPALFLFFAFTWKFLTSATRRLKILSGILAILSFTFLVFSYFYLWTTAVAWVFGLILLTIIFRSRDWRKTAISLLVLGAFLSLVLIPYFVLLANRGTIIDSVHLLVFTRQPDLWRIPEILSFAVLFGFFAAKGLGWLDLREPKILFLMAFALVAPIVFNQQILSGRSLQPVHYQFYCVNYISAFSLLTFVCVLLNKKVNSRTFNKILLLLGLAALYVGYSDGQFSVKKARGENIWRDELLPVAQKIKTISQSSENYGKNQTSTVLSFDFYPYTLMNSIYSLNCSDDLPALSSQAVLWSPRQKVFSDLSPEESTDRLFKFIYYQNFDEKWLAKELQNERAGLVEGFFGWDTKAAILTDQAKPVTNEKIDEIVGRYVKFRQNFNYENAKTPTLSFVIIHQATQANLSAVDKWYERDAGESVGKYTLYRVKLRNP